MIYAECKPWYKWYIERTKKCSIFSYDMRTDLSGRHWMERRTFGDRASFHIEATGARTRDGVRVLRSYLRITSLEPRDAGPYRCRVDFKKAPTRNVICLFCSSICPV